MTGLSPHGLAMLLFAAIVFAVFIWDRVPIATVSLAVLFLLPLGFVLFPLPGQGEAAALRFFAGFGHPALVAICGLMVVGQGLVVTGALEPAARLLASWVAASPRLALAALLVGAASISGLVNDTPVVVLLIPLIIAAAARAGTAAGTMLLPMNYAVLIGGMATTIGTSTNLIVVAIAASLGVGAFNLFDFYPLVAMAAVPALLYLWLLAPRLLRQVQAPAEEMSQQAFDAELHVEPGSWLEGRELAEVLKVTGGRMQLREVRRGERAVARLPSMKLQAGDRLLIQDTVADLKDFEGSLHAKLHGIELDGSAAKEGGEGAQKDASAEKGDKAGRDGRDGKDGKDEDEADGKALPPASAVVSQLIVPGTSWLVGRTMRGAGIAERYGVAIVGLRPRRLQAGWEREGLSERVIGPGDIVLLQGSEGAMAAVQRDGVGLLLDAHFTLPRQEKATVALLTMAAVVLLAATKILPISLAALGGVVALLVLRCLSWQDVAQSLSVKVILLVAASLALGNALEMSGATAWLAHRLADAAQGLPPAWVLALLMALMGLMTNFVSNNASAAIGTPLGIELARAMGAPPEAFVLAVLFGCNLCYLTPMGYQTNLLVMNAGGYRFSDFVKVGTPLFLIMWGGLSALLAWRYFA